MGRLENRGGGSERKGPPGPPQAALLAHRVDTLLAARPWVSRSSHPSPAAGGFSPERSAQGPSGPLSPALGVGLSCLRGKCLKQLS